MAAKFLQSFGIKWTVKYRSRVQERLARRNASILDVSSRSHVRYLLHSTAYVAATKSSGSLCVGIWQARSSAVWKQLSTTKRNQHIMHNSSVSSIINTSMAWAWYECCNWPGHGSCSGKPTMYKQISALPGLRYCA